MSREIEFRAWSKNGNAYINGFNMIGFSTGQGAPARKLQRFDTEWEMDAIVLEEFTGRRDSKRTKEYPEGQKVWEGDVIRFIENEALPEFIGVVEYEKNKAAYWIHNAVTESAFYIWDMTTDSTIEVLGSIHQNPELLEATK